MKKLFPFLALAIFYIPLFAQIGDQKFIWAVASAAYQVEGEYRADGKGLSNWDVYTNEDHVTEALTGSNQTGNIAINAYDRTQYLKDIALMKQLGVTAYRFSIAWSRVIPDGTGKVNEKGLAHYNQLIDDLLASGIEPMITLYHWDLPQALQKQGGFLNPASVQWFQEYANLIFDRFGKKVKKFITFNEPYIENFLITPVVNNIIAKKAAVFAFSSEQLAERTTATHHLLLANALAIRDYHKKKLGGIIGITLSLSPAIPMDSSNAADVQAAVKQDGIHNRWFLDPLFKGKYPEDILHLYQQHNKNLKPSESDYALFAANRPDFLGINFYSPAYVRADSTMPFGVRWLGTNPDSIKMFNGPVRPEYLYKLLMHLKDDYNNPLMIITENGAGFGKRDDSLVNNQVNDSLRTDYIKRHIDAALRARKNGANLQGYTLWSMFDNFEWISGYNSRFGIVYVNFDTQERIPKKSYYEYQQIIRSFH